MNTLKNQVNEMFNLAVSEAHHYTKINNPKLYGLSGDAFVKAYVEATIADKTGFTEGFCIFCQNRIRIGGRMPKFPSVEKYMRNCFAARYQWLKRTEQS